MSRVEALERSLEQAHVARRRAEAALADAREAVNVRSQFLASMGHTLRTPLNGILGFADMLLEGTAGPLTDRQIKYVKRIADSGARQLQLINNLVDLASIHARQAKKVLGSCDVAAVIDEALGAHYSQTQEKHLNIDLQIDDNLAHVEADLDGLRTVITNLVNNAVRYSEPGGDLVISATCCANPSTGSGADVVRLCVADSGPGVSPDDRHSLLDDFENAASMTARRQRRSGVGLALSRRIVEAHGGRIWIESEGIPGRGSQFFVELPIQARARDAA
jgi:signal transduction histidine kinase